MNSNPIRVAMAAISGRIFAGRPTKDGRGFKEPRYDVTGDVFAAIRDFVGIGNEIEVGLPGTAVEFRIAVLPPYTPATPGALDPATVEPTAPGEVEGEPCRFVDCPPGLFRWGGLLCFKSEYSSKPGQPDAYCVDSGEYFWGGTSGDLEKRRNLTVTPLSATTPSQVLDAATVERCAQVIEDHGNTWGLSYRSMTDALANAVRALATDPHQHGGKGA